MEIHARLSLVGRKGLTAIGNSDFCLSLAIGYNIQPGLMLFVSLWPIRKRYIICGHNALASMLEFYATI